jgi:DNA-binding response OmpR family regulator
MKRVLVVEDEPAVADVIEFALRKAGYEVELASSKQSAESRLQPGRFAALILDLGLPDGDGIELCRWLRARPDQALHSLPILIVTCRDEEVDRVLGLENGADDYVVKPFSPRELTARLSSVLRRAHNQFGHERELLLGPLCLNRVSFRVTVDSDGSDLRSGKSPSVVPLTKTEFELLWALCESPDRVFTRDGLVARAFQGNRVSQRTVDSHIKGIRQKCLALNPSWDPIETIYGVGYKARTESS